METARANLRAALARVGLAARWEEVDLRSAGCPARLRGFPSPTVLVDGADVFTGAKEQPGQSACRFGGAPGVGPIAAALKARSWSSMLAPLPAALAGLLPATFCPACYPALGGLLGAIGLGAYAERLLAPLTLVLLAAALVGLGFEGRRGGDYRPLALGGFGAAAMYAGQFLIASALVKFAGIAVLLAASFWNVFPRLKRSRDSCPACAEGR